MTVNFSVIQFNNYNRIDFFKCKCEDVLYINIGVIFAKCNKTIINWYKQKKGVKSNNLY